MKIDELLHEKREKILQIAQKHGAYNVRIFDLGVQDKPQLDEEVDFLVNLEPERSLLDQGGLLMELRDLLGCEVYVFTEAGLQEDYRDRVLKEAIPV
ncbi:MAG TPA: nucleotidyltransferase [Cyanobacteria bacterium UBA8553]|nr:nucleotidyltransferase [Cyanobacteria bacterium UBA8553]HAJ60872.1 nucleotidyltransferase [Cyanobacteria bacterium UBA8543]